MKQLLTLCCLCLSLTLGAATPQKAPATVEKAADSTFVVSLLERAATAKPACPELFFARAFLGRPYVAYTLEVADPEALVVNTRELDCTTLVENVAALTLCHAHGERSYAHFKQRLRQLRYRQGRLTDYTSRLHYFTDWIADNSRMGLVAEVQEARKPFIATQTISVGYMSKHPQTYAALKKHPAFIPVIARQEQQLCGLTFRYIPKALVADTAALRRVVADGDVLAITCSKPGLDIAHLGFAVWQADGLHLLNASQLHKKVVSEPMPLAQYLGKHPSHTGIRVVRIKKK